MKRTSFHYYIWASITSAAGYAFGAFAVVIGIVSFYVLPNDQVSIRYPVTIGFILFSIAYIGFIAAFNIYKDLSKSLYRYPLRPKVIHTREPPKYYSDAIAVFITEPTEALSNDSIVSIYILANEFEDLIAIGKVINVQDDKKVQVLIIYDHDLSKHKERIMNNHKEDLAKLVVKPTVPSFILHGGLNVG